MPQKNTEETIKTPVRRGRKPAKSSNILPQDPVVQENTRHISENTKEIQNNTKMIHILYGIIILLMIIIAWLAFWLGSVFWWASTFWWKSTNNSWENAWNTPTQAENITVTVIDDTRCSDCQTSAIAEQLKTLPFLSGANFIEKEFSEDGVEALMKENNITKIPAIIFSTNNMFDGGQITPYLTELPNESYSLELGATFNPFAERSERGFLTMDMETLANMQDISYIKWSSDATVTWFEFSDFGCTFCQKMHADDKTVSKILEKYEWVVNNRFMHMAYRNKEVPEVVECIAETAGKDAFNTLIDQGFAQRISTKADVYKIADENNIAYKEAEVDACISDGRMKTKIDAHMEIGQNTFHISGTPGNILVNVNTGEYEFISGAYPEATFSEVIEKLK